MSLDHVCVAGDGPIPISTLLCRFYCQSVSAHRFTSASSPVSLADRMAAAPKLRFTSGHAACCGAGTRPRLTRAQTRLHRIYVHSDPVIEWLSHMVISLFIQFSKSIQMPSTMRLTRPHKCTSDHVQGHFRGKSMSHEHEPLNC